MSERHDHATWSDDHLFNEFERIAELRNKVPMRGERLKQVQSELARVVFEINYRALGKDVDSVE